ncbi:MAG: HEPN domain-containing protein [Sphingomonadales bacterium]
MIVADWLKRADRALSSAALLLDSDPDRACSSAYYAMFYSARAALIYVGQPERAMGKTHSGMVSAFNQYLVLTGLIARNHGKAFPFELNRRLVADYEAEGVDADTAKHAITSATAFVAAIKMLVAKAE